MQQGLASYQKRLDAEDNAYVALWVKEACAPGAHPEELVDVVRDNLSNVFQSAVLITLPKVYLFSL